MLIVIEQTDEYIRDAAGQDAFRQFIEGLIQMVKRTLTGEVTGMLSKVLVVSHARVTVM